MAQATYQYVVTANQIVAKLDDGGERYLDKGAVLPSNTAKDHRDHLVDVGLVEKAKVGEADTTTSETGGSGSSSGSGETK